jgi:hypothetical protein
VYLVLSDALLDNERHTHIASLLLVHAASLFGLQAAALPGNGN